MRREQAKGRSDAIFVGDEDEYEATSSGPTRGDGLVFENLVFLNEDWNDIYLNVSATQQKGGVVKEKDLTAEEMRLFDAAKLKEFQKVLFEKRAVRLLSLEESAWVRATVPDRIVTSMFALKWKEDLEQEESCPLEAKARWAVRGCDDPDRYELGFKNATQAPTLSMEGRHLIYQLCASFGWDLEIGDVAGAFDESPPLNRPNGKLYASLPKGGIPGANIQPGQICEVLVPHYGLNDACQRWWSTVKDGATTAGGKQSIFDGCIYYVYQEGTVQVQRPGEAKPAEQKMETLVGVLGHHVDDFVGGGKGATWDSFIKKVRERFPLRKWTKGGGEFCGAVVSQDAETKEITVNQSRFVDKLKLITVPKNVEMTDAVPAGIASQLRGVLGGGNNPAERPATTSKSYFHF